MYGDVNDEELTKIKEKGFATWLKEYIRTSPEDHPLWLHELVQGPICRVTCWPIFFTRGYVFHTHEHGQHRSTHNFGVSVKGSEYCASDNEPDFYGLLQQIFELQYAGHFGLKVMMFRCDWFDPTPMRGIRVNKTGVFDICYTRRYGKYDPFILASQADQVCYIPYPKKITRRSDIDWRAVVKINPRGTIIQEENDEQIPLQDVDQGILQIEDTIEVGKLIAEEGVVEELADNNDEEQDNTDESDEKTTGTSEYGSFD
ncbi:PREDICTED: uncharacterized protein LOC104810147 [Tarenaya hassleriana]|uniref:uncharacterized protein LOC104810147 n=1 Tax=Tarenaya hassleriana TaxID=28532 RepID=UPI00053C35BC|nr:PREDICTED: uncharacterized protein LOC104810147 [Tarenaya hassleriana]